MSQNSYHSNDANVWFVHVAHFSSWWNYWNSKIKMPFTSKSIIWSPCSLFRPFMYMSKESPFAREGAHECALPIHRILVASFLQARTTAWKKIFKHRFKFGHSRIISSHFKIQSLVELTQYGEKLRKIGISVKRIKQLPYKKPKHFYICTLTCCTDINQTNNLNLPTFKDGIEKGTI